MYKNTYYDIAGNDPDDTPLFDETPVPTLTYRPSATNDKQGKWDLVYRRPAEVAQFREQNHRIEKINKPYKAISNWKLAELAEYYRDVVSSAPILSPLTTIHQSKQQLYCEIQKHFAVLLDWI
jgi:hypothetical protein